jgi:hypothetical protein
MTQIFHREGKITPIEIAERVIESIDDSQDASDDNTPLNIFISWNKEDIKKQAEESAKRFKVIQAMKLNVINIPKGRKATFDI